MPINPNQDVNSDNNYSFTYDAQQQINSDLRSMQQPEQLPSNLQQAQQQPQKTAQQQPQLPQGTLNPGLAEREIEEILASSGVINGNVVNGVKLSLAIADIIVKNNQLLIEAIQSGNLNRPPLDDTAGQNQTAQPTMMWEAGTAPQAGMPQPDTTTNH